MILRLVHGNEVEFHARHENLNFMPGMKSDDIEATAKLQFNENAIKCLLKTHEPIFHGHENGDSPFHGLCQAHENPLINS